MTFSVSSVARIFLLVVCCGVAMSGCARRDGGAPVQFGSGQEAVSPSGARTHVVARGETVYRIAMRYGVKVDDVAAANRLDGRYTIKVGQRLSVPRKAGAPIVVPQRNVRTASRTKAAPAATAPKVAALPQTSVPSGTVAPRSEPVTVTEQTSLADAPAKVLKRFARKPLPNPVVGPGATVQPAVVSGSGQTFVWPVSGSVISGFGVKENGLHNDGINIKVSPGTPVRAAKTGVVTYAGNELKGYGNLLLIKHKDGYVTAYAHNDRLLVREGQEVRQGDVIAEAGTSGGVDTPQVHFEIRRGRKAINPAQFLSGV